MNNEMKLEEQKKTPREIAAKIGRFTISSILIVLMALSAIAAAMGTIAMVYNCFIL